MSVITTAPDETYQHARNAYLATDPTNEQLRAPLDRQPAITSSRVIGPSPAGLEAAVNQACVDLIMLLGITTLTPPTLPLDRRPSWPPPKGKRLKKG